MIISAWPDFKKEPPTNIVSLMTRRVTSSEQFQVTKRFQLGYFSRGLSRPHACQQDGKGQKREYSNQQVKTVHDPKLFFLTRVPFACRFSLLRC